jgi:general secretion pathway protein G
MIFVAHNFSNPNKVHIYSTESQIKSVCNGLNQYKEDVGHYPTNDQGLRVLYEKPFGVDGDKWNGPYLKNENTIIDSWGKDLNYCYPGSHNIKSFDLWSYGRDGKPGGKEYDADIRLNVRIVVTESRIITISDGLNRFKNDVGHYPTNDQGLRVLYEKPFGVDGDKWNGPYRINRITRDAWGKDFNYCYPGIHNINSFDLWSYGRDGKPGGIRNNADIWNW